MPHPSIRSHQGRPANPAQVDRNIETGNRIQQGSLFHQVGQHCHPRRLVEGLQHPQHHTEKVYVPDRHNVRGRQRGQEGDKSSHRRLNHHQEPLAVNPVGDDPADHQQADVGHSIEEQDQAQLGLGTGHLQHQPANDEELHSLGHRLDG